MLKKIMFLFIAILVASCGDPNRARKPSILIVPFSFESSDKTGMTYLYQELGKEELLGEHNNFKISPSNVSNLYLTSPVQIDEISANNFKKKMLTTDFSNTSVEVFMYFAHPSHMYSSKLDELLPYVKDLQILMEEKKIKNYKISFISYRPYWDKAYSKSDENNEKSCAGKIVDQEKIAEFKDAIISWAKNNNIEYSDNDIVFVECYNWSKSLAQLYTNRRSSN